MLGQRVQIPRASTSSVRLPRSRAPVVTVRAASAGATWENTYYPKEVDAANNVKPWYIINAEGESSSTFVAKSPLAPLGVGFRTQPPIWWEA